MAHMSDFMMPQLKWLAYRFVDNLRFLNKLTLALLAIVLISYVSVYRPQQLKLTSMAETSINKPSTAQITKPVAADLNAYTSQFPKLSMRAAKINTLIDIAKQQNILLDEVMYKSDTNSNQPLSHYQVAFSVFAPYPEIHHFLSSVLTQMPYVGIDSLNISRENVQENIVEARIQLTFYFANTI